MGRRWAGLATATMLVAVAACGAPEDVYNPRAADPPPGGGGHLVLDPDKVPDPAYVPMLGAAESHCAEIDAPTLAAQIEAESQWNPDAQSPAGAKGISQFMDQTWAAFGLDGDRDGVADVWDPADAIPSQGLYVCNSVASVLQGIEQGALPEGQTLQLALAAYNAGYGHVLDYGGIPPFPETQQYVATIMERRHHYALPAGGEPPRAGYPPAPGECADQGDPMEAGLQPPTVHGLRCVRETYPYSVITSGWRERGSTPGSDHPLGLAIDVVSAENDWETPEGIRQNWQVVHWLQVNADRLGVKYIIFHNYRWPGYDGRLVWVPYDHESGGGPSLDHHDHVHVSFLASGGNTQADLINHSPREGTHPRGIWLDPEEALP